LVADHAATHEVPLHELPTFERLELVGLLDFRENGDPRTNVKNGDLVGMLSTSFGIELNPGMEAVVQYWGQEWDEHFNDD
jgi:hypothetical protein